MKRIAIICICGIGFAWWFPWHAFAAGVGVLIGWNVLEQPKAVADVIQKIQDAVG